MYIDACILIIQSAKLLTAFSTIINTHKKRCMNDLKLTVFMLVMIVALSTIVDAFRNGYDYNGSCCEYFHYNYKLIEEYIHSIITVVILAK